MKDTTILALNKETNEEDIVFLDDVLWELSQHHRWTTIESRLNDGESLETDSHEYRLSDEDIGNIIDYEHVLSGKYRDYYSQPIYNTRNNVCNTEEIPMPPNKIS